MFHLQDVSLTVAERRFRLFRDAMLFALGLRPDLHRAGIILRGDTGFRLIPVDGVTCMRDVRDWLVEHEEALTQGAPSSAALVIPTAPDGTIRSRPAGEGAAGYDVNIWVVDNHGRANTAVVRCVLENGVLVRHRWEPTRPRSAEAVASLLGTLLAEFSDPPPAPMRLALRAAA